MSSSGTRFRKALRKENPLQIVGVINAYAALMAERVGYRALYLSGAGVANASYGLPDLGMTSMNDVLEDVGRITSVTDTPLLVDIDTGWGSAFNIARTVKSMIRAGVGAVHIEDQVSPKRCGQRPNKVIVSIDEMCDRIKAAVDAKTDEQFVVMAPYRCVGWRGPGCRGGARVAIRRGRRRRDLRGSDDGPRHVPAHNRGGRRARVGQSHRVRQHALVFPARASACRGQDGLISNVRFPGDEPAALRVYTAIREEGTQRSVVDTMQSREELYDLIGYEGYESSLDELYATKPVSDAGNGVEKPDS